MPIDAKHGNLRTGRRRHLCMQDDQIGPKIVGLAAAEIAILSPSIIKKDIVVNNLVSQLHVQGVASYPG
jgi:hypothetical protein